MKLTAKQAEELSETLEHMFEDVKAVKKEASNTPCQSVFLSNIMNYFDFAGVPGAMRILVTLQTMDTR